MNNLVEILKRFLFVGSIVNFVFYDLKNQESCAMGSEIIFCGGYNLNNSDFLRLSANQILFNLLDGIFKVIPRFYV